MKRKETKTTGLEIIVGFLFSIAGFFIVTLGLTHLEDVGLIEKLSDDGGMCMVYGMEYGAMIGALLGIFFVDKTILKNRKTNIAGICICILLIGVIAISHFFVLFIFLFWILPFLPIGICMTGYHAGYLLSKKSLPLDEKNGIQVEKSSGTPKPDVMNIRMKKWVFKTVMALVLAAAVLSGLKLVENKLLKKKELARRTVQLQVQYDHAIKQLENKDLFIRLDGIASLEHLAQDDKVYHYRVLDVFAEYARKNGSSETAANEKVKPDVQAVLTALGRRNFLYELEDRKDMTIQLSGIHLEGANLKHAVFDGIVFRNADFKNAVLDSVRFYRSDLYGADLSGASLSGAFLCMTNCIRANFKGTVVSRADLQGSDFSHACLVGADLSKSSIANAKFNNALLQHVNLTGAYGWGTDFSGADMKHANLTLSSLTCPKFIGANLSNTVLLGADWSYADLTRADFTNTAWKQIRDLRSANIAQIQNPPDGFIAFAKSKEAFEKNK